MKFIALPVSQGDSFYAETDDKFCVLVDGGSSRDALPSLFREYTRRDRVNVLVCTHNDKDHAEGIIGFLENGLKCGALWIPATWLEALLSLPPDAHESLEFLWEHLRDLYKRGPVALMEGDLQESSWRAVFPEFQEHRAAEDHLDKATVTDVADQKVPISEILTDVIDAIDGHLELLSGALWPWRHPWRCWFGDERDRLVHTVLRDTKRLLELARIALDHGIAVRSFRHDPQRAAPLQGCPLVPLSARSLHYRKPRRGAGEFFGLACLTTVNRESLVCYLDGGNGGPGVLFTAESDLRNVNLLAIPQGSIATAPHHGSADNRNAYKRIGGPMVWVRSDGYSKQRPCPEYLNAPGRRFCTLCRGSTFPKQAVRLYTRKGCWVPRSTQRCHCRPGGCV